MQDYYQFKCIFNDKIGIPTDLIGIEIFIDDVCQEVETNRKMTFLTLAFTPTVKNPIRVLEMLQKHGSCDHFHDEEDVINILSDSIFNNVVQRRSEDAYSPTKKDFMLSS